MRIVLSERDRGWVTRADLEPAIGPALDRYLGALIADPYLARTADLDVWTASPGCCFFMLETMFIAVTRIKAPAMAQQRMVDGFRRGGLELRRFPGFLGFELWRNGETLEAVSRWESQQAMEAYRASPLFGGHHEPGSTSGVSAEALTFDAETIV